MESLEIQLETMDLEALIALKQEAVAILEKRKALKHARLRDSIERQAITSGLSPEERKMLFGG